MALRTATGSADSAGAKNRMTRWPGPPRSDRRSARSRPPGRRRRSWTGSRPPEATEQAAADVAGARGDELLVGVDPVTPLQGEQPPGAEPFGEADERDGAAGQDDVDQLARGTSGTDGKGNPLGTVPTTATPRAARSSTWEATSPPTRTISDQGASGGQPRAREKSTSAPSPCPRSPDRPGRHLAPAGRSVRERRPAGRECRAGGATRRESPGSVSPRTNPVTIGFDRNSATQPTRSRPATTRMIPAARAIAAV